ncbi:hypothetical protein [Marinomonas balearica]|uniref:Uncharacterized protein n=1 Tax=Marinomonas balearica TaxID=491947 RepID=A0A4R6MCK3_9GAMM|nr:hypothetical protein [Marinomonas balearica]TDO99381.1 hypothetical protein DFP79_0362 [Marinomonas balearica]
MTKSEKVEIVESTENEATEELSGSVEKASESAASELDQLRNIVFGAAKADLDERIRALQSEMRAGFEQATQSLHQQISNVQAALQESVNSLEDRIGQVDSHYDYKTSELTKNIETLAAEVESNDENNRQLDEALHKRIDEEIQQLTDQFTQKHNQTIDLLNQVKKELNSSKTDRKTLAKLLATVATNLETEEDI